MSKVERFLISTLVFLVPMACAAQQAAPPPAATPPAPAVANAEFLRAADEVMADVSRLLDLPVKEPLKKSIRSKKEIREFLLKQIREDKEAARRYADQRALERFGLLPKGFDMEGFLVELLTEQIAGLYDPKAREFFIADWIDLSQQKMVMAHELVHALHDQYFKVDTWVDAAKPNDDAQMARDSVLEGAALAGMYDYLLREQNRSVRDMPDMEKMIRMAMLSEYAGNSLFAQAPMFIRESLLFPYLSGMVFTQRVLKSGTGWKDFNKVFANPPASTQQILHPDLYLAGVTAKAVKLPELVPLLSKDWKELDQNVMGEFGTYMLLKQFLGEERAAALSPAWSGDKYSILESAKTKQTILVFRLRLDAPESAAKFFGQYSEALELKHKVRTELFRRPNFFSFTTDEGGIFLQCSGTECLIGEGLSRVAFDKIIRSVGWPQAPSPADKNANPAKTATYVRPPSVQFASLP
ncbi:MAG: hypothetical protein HY046_11575 [Acidobacteria bacterium]|nr:hypothetical protein [Acidobacteriota bacterium]